MNDTGGNALYADMRFFYLALAKAREAFREGYSPVGAVLVDVVDGNYRYWEAESRRQIGNVLHAEFRVLSMTGAAEGMTLYSTLEPCIMCSGMAAVMKVATIKWLVDDEWGGASRVYNPDNAYIKARFPAMEKFAGAPFLHDEAQTMWVEYLRKTGHSDAVQFMLGLEGD